MNGYNDEQQAIVDHREGPALAAAVAGAGKTKAVVGRIIALIMSGVPAEKILAVTFSKKAGREMSERLAKALGRTKARVGTFHSLALEIVSCEIPDYRSWEIDDKNRFRTCIKQAVGHDDGMMNWREADVTLIEQYIALCMCDMARPDSIRARDIATNLYKRLLKPCANPSQLGEAYALADKIRRERRLITFDSMLMEAAEMLRDRPDVRARWAAKWLYVIADEAQDSGLGQVVMAEMLAQEHRNYMAVGDSAQVIYTWRGAKPEKIVNFEKDWPGAKVFRMGKNYRCLPRIVAVANRMLASMAPNTTLGIEMVAMREGEGIVEGRSYLDYDAEGAAVADAIQAEHTDGRRLADFAVLFRTVAQSRAVEEAFLERKIPYVLKNGVNFYERAEVKDLIAYLRLGAGRGTAEDVTRCINKPFRYLGRRFLDRIAATRRGGRTWTEVVREVLASGEGLQSRQIPTAVAWCEIIESIAVKLAAYRGAVALGVPHTPLNTGALLDKIATVTKYVEWITHSEGEESVDNSRVSNVRECIRVAYKFASPDEFLDYVDATIEAAKVAQRENAKIDAVEMSTVHSSKGLEWPVVHVIGVNDGVFPHGRAEDPEEERRLFYVAATRARDALYVSCVRQAVVGGRTRPLPASPFYRDGGIELVEHHAPAPDGTPTAPPAPASTLDPTLN